MLATPRALSPELFVVEMTLSPGVVLLDVRTAEEVREKPAFEGALCADYLQDTFYEILQKLDRYENYLLYCSTGKRARLAAQVMIRRGFPMVAYLDGEQDVVSALKV